jgi:uncharacterized protein (TIGR02265 family)
MTEKLTFATTVEALFVRNLGPKLPPEARNQLRQLGLDLDKPLLPAYAAPLVAQWIEVALPHVFPGVTHAEALRLLGRQSVEKYGETTIGRGLLAMVKLLGMRRILERMHRAMRTGGNYLETRCTVHGPTDVELWINDVNGMPEYFEGIFLGMAHLLDIRDVQVDVVSTDRVECTLRVRWSAAA